MRTIFALPREHRLFATASTAAGGPESDGLFDFTYYVYVAGEPGRQGCAFTRFIPASCGGYFEVKNIRETDKILPFRRR